MEYFHPAELTPSRRPVLLAEEVEFRHIVEVTVVLQQDRSVCAEVLPCATLVLTNLRLLFVPAATPPAGNNKDANTQGWALFLQELVSVEDCSTFFSRSKRVKINFARKKILADLATRFAEFSDKEGFIEAFAKVHAKRSWEKLQSRPAVTVSSSADITTTTTIRTTAITTGNAPSREPLERFSSTNAGIGGIIRRQERNLQSVDALAKSAMTDLDALIEQARDVVQVVQRYAAYMQESRASSSSTKENGDEFSETSTQVAENSEMESIMQSIGIVSPVTRLSAGRRYHEQLARQIADLLHHQSRLQRLGGMITLTDLYCVYNKARGTELVSAEDLLGACEKMSTLRLGMTLRSFPSGVKVVQLDDFNDSLFYDKLLDFIDSSEENKESGVTAGQVSIHFGFSLLVAKEKLLIAEQRLLLCRDESILGLHFFPNRFAQNWTL